MVGIVPFQTVFEESYLVLIGDQLLLWSFFISFHQSLNINITGICMITYNAFNYPHCAGFV